jgi:NAD(P)-dependent dehydrogenase (short-subunit alcohol dehydrogenase family)
VTDPFPPEAAPLLDRVRNTPGERSFRLDGRVAFVSGAAGHLGRAIVAALAEAGAHVVLNGRREEALQPVRDALAQRGLAASIVPFDVRDTEAVERGFAQVAQRHGRLDVLVNNAYAGPTGTVDSSTPDDFQKAYDVAVTGSFRCFQAARPLLRAAAERAGHASVVNVASMYGWVSPDPRIYGDSGMNSPPFYGAAKGGLLQLTRYLAAHAAAESIRVNAVSPGPFPPGRVRTPDPDFHGKLRDKVPLGRVGEAEELKGALLFLASDASSFVTGINLPVDGGWTAW